MNDTEAKEGVKLLRDNLENSATPNMELPIKAGAPIAALVYGLALIDTMAGFRYGVSANKKARRGPGVGIRYTKFIDQYLTPGRFGCDYGRLDLYKSQRCNMAHSLIPGHPHEGLFQFALTEGAASNHGKPNKEGMTDFDVPTFCKDVLDAVVTFLSEVEQSLTQSPESSLLLKEFKGWWDQGYSILVSD